MAKKSSTKRKIWYKVVEHGASCNGGDYSWSLPQNGKPGDWTTEIKFPKLCHRGYHLIPAKGLQRWIRPGRTIYVAEGKGKRSSNHDSDGKTAFSQVRLLKLIGTVPMDFNRFSANASMILAAASDPMKYYKLKDKHEARCTARFLAKQARLKAKVKEQKAKRKREQAILRKKYKGINDLYRKVSRHTNFHTAAYCWLAMRGTRLTWNKISAIGNAFGH